MKALLSLRSEDPWEKGWPADLIADDARIADEAIGNLLEILKSRDLVQAQASRGATRGPFKGVSSIRWSLTGKGLRLLQGEDLPDQSGAPIHIEHNYAPVIGANYGEVSIQMQPAAMAELLELLAERQTTQADQEHVVEALRELSAAVKNLKKDPSVIDKITKYAGLLKTSFDIAVSPLLQKTVLPYFETVLQRLGQ